MKKKKRAASIYDVAKLAGVSPSTVSRFLNRTTFVSDDKSQNIEKAIKSLAIGQIFKWVRALTRVL